MEPFALWTVLPFRSILTVTLWAVALRTIALRTITLLEALALLARLAVTVPAKIAVTITARLVLTTLSALVLTRILTRLLLTLLWSLIKALVLTRLLVADFSLLHLDLIVAVLVLKIDIEARRNRITSKNFSRRTVRLNRPQKPEIMLSMLQVVFGQNPVTR